MWHNSKYGCQMCNRGHVTFIFILDLVMRVNMHAKSEEAASWHSRVIMLTYTDGHL